MERQTSMDVVELMGMENAQLEWYEAWDEYASEDEEDED